MKNKPFENFDFIDFWDDDEYAMNEYIGAPPTEEMIEETERELGYKLPESYIWLMKQHNGGIPFNVCFPCDEPTSWADDHVAITGIMGVDKDKIYSRCGQLGSRFMIEEWGYPDIGVAICDCPSVGHDMIFLDYRECGPQGEPKVVHVDQEDDYYVTFLADNFEEFIRGLVNEEVFDTSEEDERMELEKVRNAAFSPLLSDLCAKCDHPVDTERWIRKISEEIVTDKGFFALHADERSYLLYDIQLWLYTNVYPDTTEEDYLSAYKKIIALDGEFSTGGYASDFVTDWLTRRKESGMVTCNDGILSMAAGTKEALLANRELISNKEQ